MSWRRIEDFRQCTFVAILVFVMLSTSQAETCGDAIQDSYLPLCWDIYRDVQVVDIHIYTLVVSIHLDVTRVNLHIIAADIHLDVTCVNLDVLTVDAACDQHQADDKKGTDPSSKVIEKRALRLAFFGCTYQELIRFPSTSCFRECSVRG